MRTTINTMRDSCYEVILIETKEQKVLDMIKREQENIDIKDDGKILDEVVIDDKCYAIATPGSEFSIKVNIYRNSFNKFPFPYIRIGLFCDGYDCNYWKRLDLSNDKDLPGFVSARFYGFKRDTEDIRAFVFATPDTVGNNQNRNPIRTSTGEIKVIIHEAEILGGYFDNKKSLSTEIPKLATNDGDTKFWKQASLSTIAGRRIEKNKEKFPELIKWANKSPVPSYTIQLYYHTKDMLELMQRIQLQESNLLKRKRASDQQNLIDLTQDDDDNDDNNDYNNDNENNDTVDDEYLEVVKVDKEVDVLDITDELDPQWSTVTIKRGLD